MFPGSSPKKRKSEDSEQHENEHPMWQGNNEYNHVNMEHDDAPSCSTKRPRLENGTPSDVLVSTTSDVVSQPLQHHAQHLERVREIISREFSLEIKSKEAQLELVDERLEEAKDLLERLRYAIVAEYYKKQEQAQTMIDAAAAMRTDSANDDNKEQVAQVPLHPSLKKIIGKRPQSLAEIMRACPKREAAKNAKHVLNTKSAAERREERRLLKVIREKGIVIDHSKQNIKVEPAVEPQSPIVNQTNQTKETPCSSNFVKTEYGTSRLEVPTSHVLNNTRTTNKVKCHFVVGNTSKYIGKNDEHAQAGGGNASFSHKWLVYVQTKDTEVSIQKYVKKVRFFLHPSYRPNDVVDIYEPPFQVARRGWGEFPMRIQLFFHDIFQQKPLQLVHKVVLDTTKSGRHTLGAETVVEIWLRSDTIAIADGHHIKCEKGITSNVVIPTTTVTTTTPTPVTPDATYRKPRTISFNIKETFDDNFFDFLNKIEESRTSICADIEKIEPTLLVNEPLEPQFSNTIRSPIKKELLKSPLKLTPFQPNPVKNIAARLTTQNVQITSEHHLLPVNPPTLPKAIKEAMNKLSAAINQSEINSNGVSHVKESTLVNPSVQTNLKNRCLLLPTTTVSATFPKTTLNTSSEAFITANTIKVSTMNTMNTNSIATTSAKVFNNISGTIILPVTKNQSSLQQPTQKQIPIAQVQSSISNKAVFQKKTIQVVNAQGEIKTVQMLIASPKSLANATAANPLVNTSTTSGMRIITSKALSSYTTSAMSDIGGTITTTSSPQTAVAFKVLATNPKTLLNSTQEISKPQVSMQAEGSCSPSTIPQQHRSASTNNLVSTLQPLNTSFSKNVVFQKEGKLFIIDPLQMKLKQQRKNQVSLLKPQLKQQTQQKNSTLQSSIASDHDYTPSPSVRQSSLPLFTKQNSAQIRTPQVHLGMRETRLCAIQALDHQKWQRLQLERKFNSMEFSSMRSAVEYLLRCLPLIANDKESLAFPFVRKTPHEFHSLPAFKQRSCEWLRAKFIARVLRNPKTLQALNATGVETYWTTREIAAFARFYAYTPPIKTLQQEPEFFNVETIPGSKEHFTALIKTEMRSEQLQLEYDSLSPATRITQWINNMQTHLENTQYQFSNDEVIIIDDEDESIAGDKATKALLTSEAVVRKRVYGSPLQFQSIRNNLSYLPPPTRLETAFQYVGDICKDISVRLRPEEIIPGVVHPSVQTVIAHISQLFIDRLLRQTIANKSLNQEEQHTSNSHLPHNNQGCIVTSQDIRKTISQTAEFDFLTNRHLGVATQHIKKE